MIEQLEGFNRVPRPMRLPPAPRSLRILFLYSRPPLPMGRGDELTVSHLLEFLYARGHQVDFLTLTSRAHQLRPEHEAWLRSRCRHVELIEQGRVDALLQGLRGILRGWPFQIGYLLSPIQLARAADLARRNGYDLAYAYYVRSAEALKAVGRHVPVTFLALQLSQTLNTDRLSKNATRWSERLFYRFENRRMAAYEARIWQYVTRVVLIGRKDEEAIRNACAHYGQPAIDNVVFGPHGVDIHAFAPSAMVHGEADLVMMSGVMRYAPNVEGALWFVNEVWPRVRRALPAARFYLVGRDPIPALKQLDGKDGITVTGTVPNLQDWLARATICVAPIRAAAGLQNKILEAMATGRPVVATSMANEGIGAMAGRDLEIEDDPAAMAQRLVALLNNPKRREALGKAARHFVEECWTWEGPFLELERSFLENLTFTAPSS